MIFIPVNFSKIKEAFRKYDLSSPEEDINSFSQVAEVASFKISGTNLSANIANQQFLLKAATVNDLCQLSSNPIKSSSTRDFQLYVFNQDSFYNTRKKPRFFLRALYENELTELYNIYLFRKSDCSIPIDCFPDSGKNELNYKYVVIKDTVNLNSGNFSKHFLVQLKSTELKKYNYSDPCLLKMCK